MVVAYWRHRRNLVCFFVVIFSVVLRSTGIKLPFNRGSESSRFLQTKKTAKSRGFFDAYDRSGENLFDESIYGFCSTFKPPYTGSISRDWVQTSGWSYQGQNTIAYQGEGEAKDKPFWLWFWKGRRTWTKYALMKSDHFCRNSEILAEVQLRGADEAGIVFRARGTWDFWALLLGKNGVSLVWFYEGRRRELKTCNGPRSDWTVLRISDQIADVVITCGVGSTVKDVERKMGEVEEIADNHIGAAGLVAFGGAAAFRNVFFGPVEWTPDEGAAPKLKAKAREISSPPDDTVAAALAKSDLSGITDELLRWCPDPSLCASPPYQIVKRPTTP